MNYNFDDIYTQAYNFGMVDYGSVVSKDFLELVFKRKYEQGDWAWIGPLLTLKLKIEEHGYFCRTHQGSNESCIEIMKADEMFYYMKKKRDSWMNKTKRYIDTMNAADISILESAEKMKFMHMQNVLNRDLMSMNSILKKLGSFED